VIACCRVDVGEVSVLNAKAFGAKVKELLHPSPGGDVLPIEHRAHLLPKLAGVPFSGRA
jgi:hypothetical protein